MPTVQVVNDPRHAALLAAPMRQRILEALDEPGLGLDARASAGLTRQLVAYHVRQLEDARLRRARARGAAPRLHRAHRAAHGPVPRRLARGASAPGIDPRKLKDKFSSGYLIALASRMAQEVGEAQAAAEKAGKPPADALHRRRDPPALAAGAPGLRRGAARGDRAARREVPRRHATPTAARYRVVVGAHPIRPRRRKP